MKAIRKLYAKEGLWMDDIPEPPMGMNDVKIKIHKTAICGTDIHIYNWDEWAQKNVPLPMTLGHEYMGTIIEIGENVRGYSIGDRVSGEGHITCGLCKNCRCNEAHLCSHTLGVGVGRAGAFAEYLVIPAINLYRLPDNISDEVGSILDPLGNAVHTALSFKLSGENVLITGAGPIGLMAANIAKYVGASKVIITDVNTYRLRLAKELTQAITINTQEQDLTEMIKIFEINEGIDVGLEMSGSISALEQMINVSRPGAHIALLGILPPYAPIPWQTVIFKGLTLKGIYGREMYQTWYKMVAMVQNGLNIAPIITNQFSYMKYQQAFDLMRSGLTGKVILNWNSDAS